MSERWPKENENENDREITFQTDDGFVVCALSLAFASSSNEKLFTCHVSLSLSFSGCFCGCLPLARVQHAINVLFISLFLSMFRSSFGCFARAPFALSMIKIRFWHRNSIKSMTDSFEKKPDWINKQRNKTGNKTRNHHLASDRIKTKKNNVQRQIFYMKNPNTDKWTTHNPLYIHIFINKPQSQVYLHVPCPCCLSNGSNEERNEMKQENIRHHMQNKEKNDDIFFHVAHFIEWLLHSPLVRFAFAQIENRMAGRTRQIKLIEKRRNIRTHNKT